MDVYWLCHSALAVFCLTYVSCQCVSPVLTSCDAGLSTMCCNISRIARNSVEIEYFVTQTNNSEERWRLDATVRWKAPTEDDGYTYSIDFLPTVTLLDLALSKEESINRQGKCPDEGLNFNNLQCPTRPLFPVIVEEETANFSSILFGFTYIFRIHVILNGVIFTPSACYGRCSEGGPNLQAPDCLIATGDVEFCQNQPIPVATEPRDLGVEWTIESMKVIVDITWSMPLVVNGNITKYRVFATREATQASDILFTHVNGTEIQIRPESPGVFQGGFVAGYSYLVLVGAVVDLPDHYRPTKTYDGNDATIRINIPNTDVTTPKRNHTIMESVTSSTITRALLLDPSTTKENMSVTAPRTNLPLILALLILAVLIIVIFVVVVLLYLRRHKLAADDQTVTFQVHPALHEEVKGPEALPEFRAKEIYHSDDIELVGEPIGGGQYGKVYIGYLRLGNETDNRSKVAVKTTKDGLNATMQEEFIDEIRLMIDIGEHPNIMPVLGCRTVLEPYYLITEYMDYGSLKDYLRKCNKPQYVKMDSNYTLTGLRKINIAHQISNGMGYLSHTRYFHGDLAARNILINKNMEVKISDFGLSNDIYAKGYVRLPPENKRPVKWYSPEANIHGRCSTEGDVWSYGIVLHEIYCYGREPYEGMAPREVIARIKNGYRLEKPEDCPDEMYDIMRSCWQYEASQRPTFDAIKQSLEKLLDSDDFDEKTTT